MTLFAVMLSEDHQDVPLSKKAQRKEVLKRRLKRERIESIRRNERLMNPKPKIETRQVPSKHYVLVNKPLNNSKYIRKPEPPSSSFYSSKQETQFHNKNRYMVLEPGKKKEEYNYTKDDDLQDVVV